MCQGVMIVDHTRGEEASTLRVDALMAKYLFYFVAGYIWTSHSAVLNIPLGIKSVSNLLNRISHRGLSDHV